MNELKIRLMEIIGRLYERHDDWYNLIGVYRWHYSSCMPTDTVIQRKLSHQNYNTGMIATRKALAELVEEGFVFTSTEELYNKTHTVYYPTPLLLMLEHTNENI